MYKKINSYKLFLSYFLVFLIPTILISVIVFSISDHILKKSIETNNKLTTKTGQYNLNKTLESFNIIGNSISYSNFGHSIDLRTSNTTATQLISYLNKSKLSYSFVQEIFLVYNEGDYVYSSNSSFTRDNFYCYLTVPSYTSDELNNIFKNSAAPFILPVSYLNDPVSETNSQKNYLIYSVPCMRGDYSIGTLSFLIDIDLLNKFLGNIDSNSYTYLVDINHNILNPNSRYTSEIEQFLLTTYEQGQTNPEALSISSSHDYTFITGAVIPGILHLINISSNTEALHNLTYFRNLTFFILFIAFIIGVFCVIIAFKRNYHNWVHMTSSYEDELKKVLPLKQKEVLRTLTAGNYLYPNDFEIQCEEVGLNLKAPCHYCILLKPKSELLDIEHLLSNFIGSSIDYIYNYCVERSKEKTVYLFGTGTELNLPSHYHENEECTLFISQPIYNILDVKLQYADMTSSMYIQQFSKSQDQFLELSSFSKRIHYYEACLAQINTYLSTSDIHSLSRIQKTLVETLRTDFISLPMKIKISLQLFIHFSNVVKVPFNMDAILKAVSVAELENLINLLFDTYTASITAKKESDAISLHVDSIKEFIEEHFTDPMFSLQFIADHHHVSNSYLSWFFKQKTGITVLDYTTSLKMELATKLLKTDCTLQEIAIQIGYINVSSFIRRFKQTMGMTPGEYKKKMNL